MKISATPRVYHSAKVLFAVLLLILSVQVHAQVPGATNRTIYTPMGQAVDALTNPENADIRDYAHNGNIQQITQHNWQVQLESAPTTTSQCHGWAWSIYAGGPAVEINGDVRKYFTNDAVEEIAPMTEDNWEEGVIIVFGKNMSVPVHSAVTTSEYGFVRSKWWYGAVYKHKLEEHPWASYEQGWYRVAMNGSKKVCGFGSTPTYSTTSSIPGASYAWKLSGTPVGGNSSSVSVQHFFTPNTIKHLSVEIQCPLSGTTIKSFRRICFGENSGYVPGSYYIMGSQDNSTLCPYTSYTMYVSAPCVASGFTYTLPPGFTVNWTSGGSMSFSTGSGGSGTIEVSANVWCSSYPSTCCEPAPGTNVAIAFAYVDTSNPYCGWSMSASPNPAKDYIDIETGSEKSKDASMKEASVSLTSSEDAGEWYQLTVYNSQQIPVFTTKSRDRKVTINTQQIQNGIYIAEIIRGKERISKRFAVNH
ncbi:T9SS type A sorting domain-containing protein [Fulvivirgaceae bacterium PWU4]|uniref:T9SS type A sorting domain-containing protein n=1 Tax=Chryseosolibacter histidini TaxID=2782349 RepID=A0AAP2DGT3_9BACT|nr:T9SS type A sorting domain-containing protein [Chryseosolibacter histidini]MBT1696106.1 T9SS type A sorting domain-containing protein [Chryseosolibacter histidini]